MNNILSDKDYYTSLLNSLKDLIKNYAISITEASNDELYEIYLNQLLNLLKMHRSTFNIMNENGWYELENEDKNKIDDKYNTLIDEFELIKDNK